mmetsp:Transcript_998/g.2693  ORF Transcript_998/g.2693 Transcript_998/m.2693 type:complete len:264 (+) Transcript_998:414-1205(+)
MVCMLPSPTSTPAASSSARSARASGTTSAKGARLPRPSTTHCTTTGVRRNASSSGAGATYRPLASLKCSLRRPVMRRWPLGVHTARSPVQKPPSRRSTLLVCSRLPQYPRITLGPWTISSPSPALIAPSTRLVSISTRTPGIGWPTVPRAHDASPHTPLPATSGDVSESPYPSSTLMPTMRRKCATWGSSGAAPEMESRSSPPRRARTLLHTSASSSRSRHATGGTATASTPDAASRALASAHARAKSRRLIGLASIAAQTRS